MSRIDPHLDEVADAYAQLDLEVIRNTRLTNALRLLTQAAEVVADQRDFGGTALGALSRFAADARAVLDQTNPQEQP